MTKRLGLAGVGLLYAAAAVWLVRTEGQAHRRALRERHEAHARSPVVPPPVTTAKPAPATAAPSPGPPAAPPQPNERATAAIQEPHRLPATTEQPQQKLPPLILAGLEDLSPAEEARLGKVLHGLILANHPADEESPFRRVIADAAGPLIALRVRKDVGVTITVLDSDEVNAFSHPGGYIYVTRGLFNLAATDEEFRFVVGHELAHLDLKHAQKGVGRLAKEGRLAGVGTIPALYHQIAAGFPEAEELEADDWVIDRMVRLDQTRRECLAFLRKFVGLTEKAGYRNGRKAPKSEPGAEVQDVDNHFRSLPAAWSRLERQEARLRSTPRPSIPR